MINALTGLGYGIIGFAVLIGIGVLVLGSLSSTVSSCPTGYVYNTNGSVTFTDNTCCLTGGTTCSTAGNYTDASLATQNINTINNTYIATNLITWIPVVIVLVVGLLFLGAFLTKKGKQY